MLTLERHDIIALGGVVSLELVLETQTHFARRQYFPDDYARKVRALSRVVADDVTGHVLRRSARHEEGGGVEDGSDVRKRGVEFRIEPIGVVLQRGLHTQLGRCAYYRFVDVVDSDALRVAFGVVALFEIQKQFVEPLLGGFPVDGGNREHLRVLVFYNRQQRKVDVFGNVTRLVDDYEVRAVTTPRFVALTGSEVASGDGGDDFFSIASQAFVHQLITLLDRVVLEDF